MTIRIFKLSDWALLPPNEDLRLLLDNPGRKVTIQFNTVLPTRIGWQVEGSEQSVLLGVIDGLEDVEFRPNGPGVVTVESEGEVWFYTDDGGQTVAGDGDEERSFVKLLEPRDRATELERILVMREAKHNQLMAAQAADREELTRQLAAAEAALQEAQNGQDASRVVAEPKSEANGGAGGGADPEQAIEGGAVQPAK